MVGQSPRVEREVLPPLLKPSQSTSKFKHRKAKALDDSRFCERCLRNYDKLEQQQAKIVDLSKTIWEQQLLLDQLNLDIAKLRSDNEKLMKIKLNKLHAPPSVFPYLRRRTK